MGEAAPKRGRPLFSSVRGVWSGGQGGQTQYRPGPDAGAVCFPSTFFFYIMNAVRTQHKTRIGRSVPAIGGRSSIAVCSRARRANRDTSN